MAESPGAAERSRLLAEIQDLDKELYWHVRAGSFDEWLHLDVTMPQLKTLVLVYGSEGGSLRMGQLASALGVALSTTTGIVDRLVEQGLLCRQEEPEDRRLVVVRLTTRGRETIERPHRASQRRFAAILERVGLEDLRMVAGALRVMHQAAREGWALPAEEDVPAASPAGGLPSESV